MKYLVSLFFLISLTHFTQAQGVIVGLTISPTNPTSSDTIYVYADLRFSSGSCELADQSLLITGNTVSASAHHCLDPLTFICSAVDTFKINPLADGVYNFSLDLTTGYAPAPCTAGIVIDDDSTISITVGSAGPSGIIDVSNTGFTIYPNPVQNQINLPSIDDGTAYELIAVSGQIVNSGTVKSGMISNLAGLPTGVYFLKLNMPSGAIVKRIVKQ